MKRLTVAVMTLAVAMLANAASAVGQSSAAKTDLAPDESQLIGAWTGESICQVKNSPCHDEKAIYLISKSPAPGKVTIDLGKIVDGKPETMIVLDFNYSQKNKKLICEYKRDVWEFSIIGDKMEGTLTTLDKIIYRRVSLIKVKASGK